MYGNFFQCGAMVLAYFTRFSSYLMMVEVWNVHDGCIVCFLGRSGLSTYSHDKYALFLLIVLGHLALSKKLRLDSFDAVVVVDQLDYRKITFSSMNLAEFRPIVQ